MQHHYQRTFIVGNASAVNFAVRISHFKRVRIPAASRRNDVDVRQNAYDGLFRLAVVRPAVISAVFAHFKAVKRRLVQKPVQSVSYLCAERGVRRASFRFDAVERNQFA